MEDLFNRRGASTKWAGMTRLVILYCDACVFDHAFDLRHVSCPLTVKIHLDI